MAAPMEDVYELNAIIYIYFLIYFQVSFKMMPQKPMHRVEAHMEPCRSLPA